MNAAVGTRPYSISGNTYTIDDGGGASKKFEIVTLNSSSFVRKFTSTSGTSTTVSTVTLLR
ncbi:MAG: lipocalin family protein [Janthinobacterium lividum]